MKYRCLLGLSGLTSMIILQLMLARPAAAQMPLDSSFGQKGAAFLNLYDSLIGLGQIHDYVFDNSGNAYVLLPRWMNMLNGISDGDAIVVKFTSAGKLDSSFNGMGYAVIHNVYIDLQIPDTWPAFLRLSNDGSNITVYSNFSGTLNTYRLTNEGLPDYSHGVKGFRNIGLAAHGTLIDARKTADNGTWLLQIYFPATDTVQYSVSKLDANDNIDPSFRNSSINVGTDGSSLAYAGELPLPDGGMLVGMRNKLSGGELSAISWIKFKADGSVDSSYGKNGISDFVTSVPEGTINTPPTMHAILLPDMSVLTMFLVSDIYYTHNIYQLKLTPSGIVDSSFGNKGVNITSIGYLNDFIGRYTDAGDLNFWATRNTTDSAGYVSMRVTAAGYIDSSYVHTRPYTPFYTVGYNLQFGPDAWVTDRNITGARFYNGNQNSGTLSIARLDSLANADLSYGVGGKTLFTDGVSDDELLGIAGLPDGRMIGVATDGVQERLFRVTTDGRLDKSFGNGRTLVPLDTNYRPSGYAYVAVDSKGRPLVVGQNYAANIVDQTVVSRYTADGSPDPSFGQQGYFTLNNEKGTNVWDDMEYVATAIQPDNKVVLMFRHVSGIPQTSVVAVLRLAENGVPDNTFGSNGWASFNYAFDFPELITVLHNGNILVSGTYQDGNKQYLTELSPSGQQLFVPGRGAFAFTVQGTSDDHVFFLGETDSGKIVYAINGTDYTTRVQCIASRLNSDLSYDYSAGLAYYAGDNLSAGILMHDGRLVLTGMHNATNTPPHLSMTITDKDIHIDSSFGVGGFVTYPDILPDSLVQVLPYSTIVSANQGYAYGQVYAFKDVNGQVVTATTAKKDSLGDIFLMRTLFYDTVKGYAPPPPPPPPPPSPAIGSLVVWAPAICNGQTVIGLAMYDSTGAVLQTTGNPARLVTAVNGPPACNGNGGYTYTAPAGNYALKAFCGADSVTFKVTIKADSCISQEVNFNSQPVPPPDTTSGRPNVIVAPNPTSGIVDIRLSSPDNGIIQVSDMAGRLVLRMVFNGSDIKLDLFGLAKGYYVLEVKGAKYSRTVALLKL